MDYSAKFDAAYRGKVTEFCEQLLKNAPAEEYRGIPQLFLPMCGKEYHFALKKIGFVGIETLGWGHLDTFLKNYNSKTYDFQWEREAFQNFAFLDWGTTKRLEFWHFWLMILSFVYGLRISDLQQGKLNLLLDSFVWGNCNSIETSNSNTIKNAKNLGSGYQYAKKVSSELFDHIELMNSVYDMDAVIVACKDCWHFLGNGFEELPCDSPHIRVFKKKDGKLLVFQCNHPHGTIKTGGPEPNALEIRALLQQYNLFCPLPNILKNGLSDNSKAILIDALRKEYQQKGNGAKFEAIAIVAKELHNQNSCMTAAMLCDILNEAGFRNQFGDEYTGNGKGPCSLVRSAYNCYKDAHPGIAEDIAFAFTKKDGMYAYN